MSSFGEQLWAVSVSAIKAARHTDPARLRAVLADLRAKCDPGGAEAAVAAHDRRRLTVAGTFAGAVVLDGVLDPEGGATVLAALAVAGLRATVASRHPWGYDEAAAVERDRLLAGGG